MGAAGSVLDEESMAGPPVRNNNNQANINRPRPTGDLSHCPSFLVNLGFWAGNVIVLPDQFKLRISFESLDFVRTDDDTPLVQFPYQNIICWGSSPQNFQFKVFDFEKSDAQKRDSGMLISLRTNQGKAIEDATMSSVQKLMVDMGQAISKPEFQVLLTNLFDEGGHLKEDWMPIVDQFTSSGRKFLAKQGMELLHKIGSQAPFEKFELACLIFDRMVNKNSVQLLINTFDDPQDRDNLIHRLHLNKGDKRLVVNNCAMLPENVLSPPPLLPPAS
jgi:hypothetical protein